MLSIYYVSTLSFGKIIIAGVCCYIIYKLKNKIIDPAFEYTKLSNLITKAEQEANEKKRQEQEKARQAAAESYESSSNYQKSAIKKEYDEDYYQNYNEDESFYSQPKEEHINVQTQKQKTPEIKYYCKYCGDEFNKIKDMTGRSCIRHPNGPNKGKHSPYGGLYGNKYYCKYCGDEFNKIKDMTGRSCIRHPNGPNKGKHSPYEGHDKNKYYCMHCGDEFNKIKDMTGRSCIRHPNGPNKGKHQPR